MTKNRTPKSLLPLTISSLLSLSLACGGQESVQAPAAASQSTGQVSCTQKPNPDLPVLEANAAELQKTFDTVIADADRKLAALAALANVNPRKLSFENTILAFEEVFDAVNLAANRNYLIMQVSPTLELQAKAGDLYGAYVTWTNTTLNNGAIYKVLRAYARKNPKLAADQKKLLDDTLNTFKRNGLSDDGVPIPAVATLQNEIARLQGLIGDAYVAANAATTIFTASELAGLSAAQLASLTQNAAGDYVIANGSLSKLRDLVMTYATQESARKKAMVALHQRGIEQPNLDNITALVKVRLELAQVLGYQSWADYRDEVMMAGAAATAPDFSAVAAKFLDDMALRIKNGVDGKMDRELADMQYLVNNTAGDLGQNDDNGVIDSWDVFYFKNLYVKEKFTIDYAALSQYFPYQSVVAGILQTYEKVFGLEMELVENPKVWSKEVQLVKVSDARGDRKVIGYIYLDNFPRLDAGKTNFAECDSLVYGKALRNGTYRKPVAVVINNFAVNGDGTPANMVYSDIDTFFHELGHALHIVLGKARFASQNGFSTPTDFVEVPSTLSEQWRFDPTVFKLMTGSTVDDAFAQTTIGNLKKADLAVKGLFYGRQFGFDKADFALHRVTDTTNLDVVAVTNQAMAGAYLPYPENTAFLPSWMHPLTWGYDGCVYAYQWSDAIAAELAKPFKDSALGFLDPKVGRRYRKEVLEPGNSRDPNASVQAFTGRPLDPTFQAFIDSLAGN